MPEAMAEGLPVVASDVTGNRSIVVNERNGLLFPVNRVDALVAAAKHLVLDKRLRASLGESGSQVALRDYSAEREVDALEDALQKHLRRLRQTPRPFHRLKAGRLRQAFAFIGTILGPPLLAIPFGELHSVGRGILLDRTREDYCHRNLAPWHDSWRQ